MKIKKIVVGSLRANCYLLISDNETVVIDPGDEVNKILKEIGRARVKYIVLTHYHFDHVLTAQEIRKKTGAEILIHEQDKNFLNFPADRYLQENEEIKIGQNILKVIHSPGHTQGSICLMGEREIFVGDLLFEDGYGRADLPGGSEEDLRNSLQKLEKILPKGTMVYPGHGDEFYDFI